MSTSAGSCSARSRRRSGSSRRWPRRPASIDLWIEAGPGRVLSGLVAGWIRAPVVAIEAGGESLRGLLRAAGAAFALGAPIRPAPCSTADSTRPFPIPWQPAVLRQPLRAGPVARGALAGPSGVRAGEPRAEARVARTNRGTPQPEARLAPHPPRSPSRSSSWSAGRSRPGPSCRRRRSGDDSRLLGDLHLNSITVSQIVVEIAGRLGAAIPVEPTSFAERHGGRGRGDPRGTGAHRRRRSGRATAGRRSRGSPPGSVRSSRRSPSVPGRSALPTDRAGPWRVVAHARRSARRPFAGGDAPTRRRARRDGLPPARSRRTPRRPPAGGRTAVLREPAADRFVLVQHGGGAASFARTRPPGGPAGHGLRGGCAGRPSPMRWNGSSPRPKRRRGSPRSTTTSPAVAASRSSACCPGPSRPARRSSGRTTSCSSAGAARGSPRNAPWPWRERRGFAWRCSGGRGPTPTRSSPPISNGWRRRGCGSAMSTADVIDADAVRAAVHRGGIGAGTDHGHPPRGRGQRPAPAGVARRGRVLADARPQARRAPQSPRGRPSRTGSSCW